jgi:carbamoyl-phosphate synthase large subunit
MQHVEEAGVHSGDSACVLPATSLTPLELTYVQEIVRELGAAVGAIGLLNVQLAIADGDLHVLEVNPRASRTVPFASKATGINLVAAACRLAAGANLGDLDLPADPTPGQVSVKAAVLPFARFPGADPVLGPEMRATGEVMATAADFPTAFAKAERAAGRALPAAGAAFISVCDEHKRSIVPVAHALAGLGFDLLATGGTAHVLAAAGLAVEYVRKVTEERAGPSVVDLIKRGRVALVVNTPHGSGARSDGYRIREAALVARVPCITTISGAAAAVEAIAHAQPEISVSLQERIGAARAS